MDTLDQLKLEDRSRTLADSWFAAANDEGLAIDKNGEIRAHFLHIAFEAVTLLETEAFSLAKAVAIGTALSDLFTGQPAGLSISVEVLASELPAVIPDEQFMNHQSRFAALLGGITRGYLQQASSFATSNQGMNKAPYTSSMQAPPEDLILQENRLRDINEQLQFQNEYRARMETAHKKTEAELQLAVDRLLIINNIEIGILAAKSPQAIAEIALGHLDNIVPCLSSAVSLFDSDYRYSEILASLHTIRVPGGRTPITPSPIWDMLIQGQTVVLNDLASMANITEGFQAAIESGGRALMIVPLLVQGQIIGAITLISGKVDAFMNNGMEAVRQIGDSVAIAIHNAQLFETEQKARREADTLQEVASNINASLDQDELLDLILTQLELVLPYDSASILQYKKGTLVITAQHGLNPISLSVLSVLDPIPPNIVTLMDQQRPLIIADTREHPEWEVFPGAEKIRCWLGVPLMAKDSFIGLLMLDKWEPHFYSDQSAKLALAFANHAAITIENARLYHETQQYGARMERQVALRTRDLATLYDITAVSNQFLDLNKQLDIVLSRISSALNCSTVTLQILDETGTTLHLTNSLGLSSAFTEYLQEISVDNPFMQEIIHNKQATVYSDVQSDPRASEAPIRETITYSAGAPIRSRREVIGILGIGSERQYPFSREDVALLTSIADHVGLAIENARLQKQAEHNVITQERERLARDLHDSATQSLFSLTLFATAARELLHNGKLSQAEHFLDDIAITANQTHKEMRLLLYELRPSALAKEGLAGALHQRLVTVENRSGIQGHISATLTVPLPAAIEGALFQVANEALNNTLRHAKADNVFVNVQSHDTQVLMEIRDNGVGFQMDLLERGAGMGMANMQQRMAAIGGTFNCHSIPDQGTTITASAEIVG